MSAIIGILFLVFVVPYLASRVAQARNAPWAGPRTPAMRGRAAARPPAQRRGPGTAAGRSAASAVRHPSNRAIRAQAATDANRLWQESLVARLFEERRRAGGTAPAAGVAAGGAATGTRPTIRQRMRLVPVVVTQPATSDGTPANGNGGHPGRPVPPPASRSNGGNTVTRDRCCFRPQAGCVCHLGCQCTCPDCQCAGSLAPAAAISNGGTTMTAGTSTASAEKAIEGINEIYAHGMAGGIHAKQEALKALHELAVRAAGMVVTFARQMSEPGSNYGPEITEPLATAGNHFQAGATTVSESDAAISTLINMTVGDLASSARQAPHHNELTENGAH